MKITNLEKGQSLFEVVVAVGISALIIVAIVSLAVDSIQNSNFSKNKSLASNYTQQAIEWLRGQRDADVAGFFNKALTAGSSEVCLNSLPVSIASLAISDCYSGATIAGTPFMREVSFYVSTHIVEADVMVSWQDSQGLHEVTDATSLADLR
jgi:Tfp pilus assembly protein PilW